MSAAPPITSPPNVRLAKPGKRLFTVSEFMRMAEAGILRGRVELVHGEIIEMASIGNAHSVALEAIHDALRVAWGPPRFIRSQATHRFAEDVAYEPDLVLLDRRPTPATDYSIDDLPQLIVEVSDKTLSYDLGQKRLDYAQFGVPEYWVADLRRRRIRAFRGPNPAAAEPEYAYRDELAADADDVISPLAIPELKIKVGDVLPGAGWD